ncbi:nuclease PIN [Leptobacterium flavescens]|uniref:Nuclease PIN n=1 Tax=Leptobacterium flavescens TaxID=472055 RepID=A0A6P0UUA7_9FLAO|nr:pirin family protein [Leptobacterium flavescens]NER15419.1 nuclease PIN [Leptobacterium flavescens]
MAVTGKLNKEDIESGGFNGIRQKRLIVHRYYGPGAGVREGTWTGIGNLVYLSDSYFDPGVETGLHPHRHIDVLTFVAEGALAHQGSLEHGVNVNTMEFQVQKAGLEGFMHNEKNTGDTPTRMLQMWVLPQEEKPEASFRIYKAEKGKRIKVYGQEDNNSTQLELAYLEDTQKIDIGPRSLVYVIKGDIIADGEPVSEGHILEVNASEIRSDKESVLLIAYEEN